VRPLTTHQLLLTVECEGRRGEVALPADVPVADLVPRLLEAAGIERARPGERSLWVLAREDGEILPGNLSLAQCQIEDGSFLRLQDMAGGRPHARPAHAAVPEAGPAAESEPEPDLEVAAAEAVRVEAEDAPEPAALEPAHRVALPPVAPFSERLRAVSEVLVAPVRPAATASAAPAAAAPASPQRLSIPRSRSALDRVRSAWRSSGYRTQLERMIAAPRLNRSVTIAVVSPKGGVGKTTVTAVLGTLLAMTRSDRVVAVDSDPDYGTLGRSLTPDHKIYVDDLLDVLHQPALTVTMLERCLGRAAHGLLVLPAPTEPDRMKRLDQEAYERIIGRLKHLAGIILLDCGAGLHDPATLAAMAASDQLVMVSDGEPRTASLVAEAALRLPSDISYTFVVNKAPRSGGRLDMGHLAQDVHAARAVIRIEAAAEQAARVAEGEFNWGEAPESWQVGFRELAAVLTSDWDELGLTA
jgi:MinD-like ATPase involved in chromosome partitioning or flagellar assembly